MLVTKDWCVIAVAECRCLVLASYSNAAETSKLDAALNVESGMLNITFGELKNSFRPTAYGAKFTGPGPGYVPFHKVNYTWDDATTTFVMEHIWGNLTWRWDLHSAIAENEIRANVTVKNTWNSTIESVQIWLADNGDPAFGHWEFPSPPLNTWDENLASCPWSSSMPCQNDGRTAPAAVVVDYGVGAVALAAADEDGNSSADGLTVGFSQIYNHHAFVAPANIAVGKERWVEFVMRFGDGGGTSNTSIARTAVIDAMVGKEFQQFRSRYPMHLDWKDRRPIGTIFLSSNGASSHCKSLSPIDCPNPRGYLSNDPTINVTTPGGIQSFHAKMLGFYNESVQRAVGMPSYARPQGIITWDLSGSEWSWITFTGDPTMVSTLAPEMASIVDSCVKLIADAGFRVGFTLRPQQITKDTAWNPSIPPTSSPQEWIQKELLNPDNSTDSEAIFNLLHRKATYAIQRWNASIFYIDTVGGRNGCYDMTIFMRLAASLPNVLFIPEGLCGVPELTFTSTLDNNMNKDVQRTSDAITYTWPAAFHVNLMQDGNTFPITHDSILPYAEAVCRGDVLLEFLWWGDFRNQIVQAAYEMVHNKTVTC